MNTRSFMWSLYLTPMVLQPSADLPSRNVWPIQAQRNSPAPAGSAAVSTRVFLDTLGVNVHLGYTDGAYANVGNVIADLDYVGIHNLRDAAPDPNGGIPYRNYITSLQKAVAAGNRFDFVTSPDLPLTTTLGQIVAVAKRPGVVIGVEGPNEINNWPAFSYHGLKGEPAALAFQKDLYSAVHADSALAGAQVYLYTGGSPLRAADQRGLADAATLHPYPNQGEQPGQHIADSFTSMFGTGSYAKVITEVGYYTHPAGRNDSGVDDATQAKGTLNLFLDAFKQGIKQTYLYQLLSAYPEDPNSSDTAFGLFRLDNAPKPAATALHNLTTILADEVSPTTSFATGRLNYTINGMPANGSHLLMQKRDKVFDLVLWAEPAFWNEGTHQPISVPPSHVSVRLGARPRIIKVFDPIAGADPIRTTSGVTTVSVDITDHPIIIEIDQ